MNSEEAKPNVVLKRSDHVKRVSAFLIVAMVVLAGFLYFKSKQSSSLPKIDDGLESCSVKKEGNSLVQSPGIYKGIIQTINFNANNTEADIQLISAVGKQTHTFTVKAEKGLAVFNFKTNKDLLLTNLKIGQNITLTSSCATNPSEEFKITQVAVN